MGEHDRVIIHIDDPGLWCERLGDLMGVARSGKASSDIQEFGGYPPTVDDPYFTAPGYFMGTPGFMAPEQASLGPIGPSADIFCLGLLLVYATTGRSAFSTGSDEPDVSAVPQPFRPLVHQCLARDPAAVPPPPNSSISSASALPMTPQPPSALSAAGPRKRGALPSLQPRPPTSASPLSRRGLLYGIVGSTLTAAGIAAWQFLPADAHSSGARGTPVRSGLPPLPPLPQVADAHGRRHGAVDASRASRPRRPGAAARR